MVNYRVLSLHVTLGRLHNLLQIAVLRLSYLNKREKGGGGLSHYCITSMDIHYRDCNDFTRTPTRKVEA